MIEQVAGLPFVAGVVSYLVAIDRASPFAISRQFAERKEEPRSNAHIARLARPDCATLPIDSTHGAREGAACGRPGGLGTAHGSQPFGFTEARLRRRLHFSGGNEAPHE